jgi:hypothetical protein
MRIASLFCVITIAFWGSAVAGQPLFNEEGFLLVDGKPRLVLGVYDLPKGGDEDAQLREVAQSGFDLMRGSTNKEQMDRLHAHGLKGWIRVRGLDLPEGDEAARQRLAKTINEFKDHPALFAWEAPDEALWRIYWSNHDWFFEDQPAELKKLIDKAAAEGNPNAAKYRGMVDKAVDYTHRQMWKEAEDLYATLWRELGQANPHPDKTMTASIEEVAPAGKAYARGWQLVRELDPKHPRWYNHAPCNSKHDRALHNEGLDAVGCDIYPAPNYTGVRGADMLPTMEPTAVGVAADLMQAAAPGKSCWMVLQGFGFYDLNLGPNAKEPTDPVRGRRPNWQETRFMAYDALLHGANALLYWGTSKIEADSVLWKDIMRMGRELRALEPAIVAPEAPVKPVVAAETNYSTFEGGDPKLMVRQVGDDWVLIAVNEWRNGVAFEIQELPKQLNGKTLYRLYSDEQHVVQNGKLRDGILGHDVHVYATSRRFEAK